MVDCEPHNVSIVCFSDASIACNRRLHFELIHPSDSQLNHAIEISIPKVGSTVKRGNLNWITEEQFKTFLVDNKFAIGHKLL